MARNTSGSSSTVSKTGFGIVLWDETHGVSVTSFSRRFVLVSSSRYNLFANMSSALPAAIAMLSSSDPGERAASARDIYRAGRELADAASRAWQHDPEFAALFERFANDN